MATKEKKMRIRQFFSIDNEEFLKNIWDNSLKPAIQDLLVKNPIPSFETLYRDGYTMIAHKYGEQLYLNTREVIIDHLIRKIRPHILEVSSEQFLIKLKSAWDDYRVAVDMITCILKYMDRVYVPAHKLEPIYNLGLILFRENIIQYSIIREHLHKSIFKIVEQQQYNNIVDKMSVRGIYQMLIDLGLNSRSVYEIDFETPFLQQLVEFYQIQSQNFLHENNHISDYIRKISTQIDEISQWAIDCFDQSTKEHIIEIVKNELITKHEEIIISMIKQSIFNMFSLNKYDELEIIYKHLKHIPNSYSTIADCANNYLFEQEKLLKETNEENSSIEYLINLKDMLNNFLIIATKYDENILEQIQCKLKDIINMNEHLVQHLLLIIKDQLNQDIKNFDNEQIKGLFKKIMLLYYSKEKVAFKEYYQNIRQQLLTLIPDVTNTVPFIEKILFAKDIYDTCTKAVSNEDKALKKQLSSDFDNIINGNENIPKYLSLYIHDKLQNDCDDKTIEILLDKIMILLSCLREMNAFEQWYKSHLAERLLSDKSISYDNEDKIILRFKTQCSSYFTNRLERMFKDIMVSKTIMNDIQCSIDLNIRVLTADIWPIRNLNFQCILPASINEDYQRFKNFYLTKHNGRCLTLQSDCGTADLIARFYAQSKNMIEERKYLLKVTTHQMIILMLFNTKQSYSFEEIQQKTNINEKYLRRALLPLITSKLKQDILRKEPNNNESIQSNDQFYIEDSFTSKQFYIKLKQIREKSNSNIEQVEIEKNIENARQSQIDATIIRIMKANKTMEHTALIIEVTNLLKNRFLPDPKLIEKRIGLLIESEYMSQPESNIKSYNYLP